MKRIAKIHMYEFATEMHMPACYLDDYKVPNLLTMEVKHALIKTIPVRYGV